MLVDTGADCDITIAARAGLVAHVRQLADQDPSLIHSQDRAGRTALYRAGCVYGNFPQGEEIVDLLLERGASLDFFVACMFGLSQEVDRFLADDPEWAARLDPEGMTSLHWAVRFRRCNGEVASAIVRRLLEGRADASAQNPTEERMQPIHHCGEWAGHPRMVDLLLQHGADINATAENGWTPLDYAMDRGRDDMVRCLEAHEG